MRRVQTGGEAALSTLMERWELPGKSLVARIGLNPREAEELAQETFVRVRQQREEFRADAEFRPWVFSIAINLARNRLRWWRRRPGIALEEWTETTITAAARKSSRRPVRSSSENAQPQSKTRLLNYGQRWCFLNTNNFLTSKLRSRSIARPKLWRRDSIVPAQS